jgi:hypothetical protein
MRPWIVLLFGRSLLLLSPLGECSSTTQGCDLVGCDEYAAIYPNVALPFEQLQKARITVCRGQECFERVSIMWG